MLKALGITFAVFWFVWLIWYITGGPLRTTNKYPLVKFQSSKGYIYATSSRP